MIHSQVHKMPKENKYFKEDLEYAVAQVKNGQSLYSVTKSSQIPFTTLQCHVSNPPKQPRAGRPNFFSEDEAQWLVAAVQYSFKCGLPLGHKGICCLAQQFLKKEERLNPFKDDKPGMDWIRKKQRKRVQHATGEFLTSKAVAARFEDEVLQAKI